MKTKSEINNLKNVWSQYYIDTLGKAIVLFEQDKKKEARTLLDEAMQKIREINPYDEESYYG